MSWFPSMEEPSGQYFSHSRPFKDDLDKSLDSMDTSPWTAPRSLGHSDYSQLSLSHASKAHANLASFSEGQHPNQYLSPVSPAHQINNDLYGPMGSWTSAMPSPAPEYNDIGQHGYQDSAGYQSGYVSPCQVSSAHLEQPSYQGGEASIPFVKQEHDTFVGSGLAFATSGFSGAQSSGLPSDAMDPIMVAHQNPAAPYLTPKMEIDDGVPATTPPGENCRHSNTPPPRHHARSRKPPRGAPKDPHKPAHRRQKARAGGASQRGASCKTCDETFHDSGHLHDHAQEAHGRPLGCVFGYAGCQATFGSKNEWKRHVLSQHVILHYWLCTDPDCMRANPRTGGTVFNRKDLYTQHVRRMHVPSEYREALSRKEHLPEWDRALRVMQDGAERKRCDLPTHMECPAPECDVQFQGSSAWDDRMEHVAKHLDASRPGEPKVVFGGYGDATLTEWARSPEVNIVRSLGGDRWELVVPLRTTAKEVGLGRKFGGYSRPGCGDVDADGESDEASF